MAALTQSAIFGVNIVAALNNDIALDLGDATAAEFRYTLWQNTMTTPDLETDTGNYGTSPWTTSVECAASGSYTQGGFALTTPTFVTDNTSTGARMLWKDGVSGVNITSFTGTPYGGMAYWDPDQTLDSGTDYGIVWHYWGSTPVTAGTLAITWNSTYLAGTLFYIPFLS